MDGLQVAGYAAAAQAGVAGLVWIAKKLTTHKVTEADREAERDAWLRKKLDAEQAGRETDREDCTGRIEALREEVSGIAHKLTETDRRLEECKRQHAVTLEQRAMDITERHKINRELRTLTAKYQELRGIVDVIETIPPPAQAAGETL